MSNIVHIGVWIPWNYIKKIVAVIAYYIKARPDDAIKRETMRFVSRKGRKCFSFAARVTQLRNSRIFNLLKCKSFVLSGTNWHRLFENTGVWTLLSDMMQKTETLLFPETRYETLFVASHGGFPHFHICAT